MGHLLNLNCSKVTRLTDNLSRVHEQFVVLLYQQVFIPSVIIKYNTVLLSAPLNKRVWTLSLNEQLDIYPRSLR